MVITIYKKKVNRYDNREDYAQWWSWQAESILWYDLFFQCVNYTFEWIPNSEWFTPLFNLSTPVSGINNASRPVRKSVVSKQRIFWDFS